jgi:hypothetical protein
MAAAFWFRQITYRLFHGLHLVNPGLKPSYSGMSCEFFYISVERVRTGNTSSGVLR